MLPGKRYDNARGLASKDFSEEGVVDEIPLVDLAEEVGYSRKTVGKKFRRAMARLRAPGVGPASRREPR